MLFTLCYLVNTHETIYTKHDLQSHHPRKPNGSHLGRGLLLIFSLSFLISAAFAFNHTVIHITWVHGPDIHARGTLVGRGDHYKHKLCDFYMISKKSSTQSWKLCQCLPDCLNTFVNHTSRNSHKTWVNIARTRRDDWLVCSCKTTTTIRFKITGL